ncbi:hypothetical protein BELL_0984g00030 [Botrytis elliptica]|uniref:Uncharacterized protein n=1 Tax=Botrytis elliptica TaxID=278938 RepID=A0A4Z1IX05_9HELO|nr:hypothetical protein BELL_0984g00030 [Botrytis elliptica]
MSVEKGFSIIRVLYDQGNIKSIAARIREENLHETHSKRNSDDYKSLICSRMLQAYVQSQELFILCIREPMNEVFPKIVNLMATLIESDLVRYLASDRCKKILKYTEDLRTSTKGKEFSLFDLIALTSLFIPKIQVSRIILYAAMR